MSLIQDIVHPKPLQAFTEGKRHTLGSDHSSSFTLYSLMLLYNIRYNMMID